MRILFLGDVVGVSGCSKLMNCLFNEIESKYGFRQNDTWGGIPGNTPANTPDDLFKLTNLQSAFDGMSGANQLISQFHRFDFAETAEFLRTNYNVCGTDNVCFPGYTGNNRTLEEETTSFYIQLNKEFELFGRPANVVAGLRHEETEVTSTALSQVPVESNWATANEFYLGFAPGENFLTQTAEYDYQLPSLDFDFDFTDDIKFRMSWSETITRPTYSDLQAGYTVDQLFRIDRGTGSGGNPELLPFESENLDLSAEYYYGDVINLYNEEEIDKLGYQWESSLVLGIDFYLYEKQYWVHGWASIIPFSKGLTDYAFVYESGDIDFDIGLVAGYKFSRNIGIFGEGRYLSYFGIDAYEVKAGINVTIF